MDTSYRYFKLTEDKQLRIVCSNGKDELVNNYSRGAYFCGIIQGNKLFVLLDIDAEGSWKVWIPLDYLKEVDYKDISQWEDIVGE